MKIRRELRKAEGIGKRSDKGKKGESNGRESGNERKVREKTAECEEERRGLDG
jgi:hypothetical protein